jgi:hypothetical protein
MIKAPFSNDGANPLYEYRDICLYKVLQAGLVQQLDQVAAIARLILVR